MYKILLVMSGKSFIGNSSSMLTPNKFPMGIGGSVVTYP